MQAIVDIGNTRVKAALFEGRTMKAIVEVSSLDDPDLLAFLQNASIQRGMYAATGKISEPWRSFIDALPYAFHSFQTGMRLPFENEYRSPETLGADRLANVAAAQVFSQRPTVWSSMREAVSPTICWKKAFATKAGLSVPD